jgi:hypothetical protein
LKKAASEMMLPGWNLDRSAVLTTEVAGEAADADALVCVLSAATAAELVALTPPTRRTAAIVQAATR